MNRFRLDWFVPGLAGAVVLAWIYPLAGAHNGPLPTKHLIEAGIVVIFFLHGVALPREELRQGLTNWRPHLLVQTWTYVVFPLLGLLLIAIVGSALPPDLQLGFFYLAVLPSTIASSVLLTAAAGGNVAAAVFSAAASNLLGVVLTPLWMSWRLSEHNAHFPIATVIAGIFVLLVLPMAAGQLVRPWLGAWVRRHRPRLAILDRLIIIGIVYTTFCDSFADHAWAGTQATTLVITLAATLALFVVAATGVWLAARTLRFAREDAIMTLFCGSKKTLAAGVPMAHLIFGSYAGLAAVLLPLMLYHPLQILLCSVLAERFNPRPG